MKYETGLESEDGVQFAIDFKISPVPGTLDQQRASARAVGRQIAERLGCTHRYTEPFDEG